MKISKQQFKAALDRAYEAGITYAVHAHPAQERSTHQESVIKFMVKHEVEHAKARKLHNARKHWNVNKTLSSFLVRGELGAGKSTPVQEEQEEAEFKEAIYELAFGDNAINRDFSEEEVISTIKGFAHDSWVAETSKNVNSTTQQQLAALETLREKMPSTLDDLLADFNFDDEVTSNCKKCNAEIKNGGDWGHCTCCYEVTRAQEEQDDEG